MSSRSISNVELDKVVDIPVSPDIVKLTAPALSVIVPVSDTKATEDISPEPSKTTQPVPYHIRKVNF